MKTYISILSAILFSNLSLAQVGIGVSNYQNDVSYADNNIDINLSTNSTTISVKGLANVKADAFVVIFSVAQVGKTTKEVNDLIDSRINQVIEKVKLKSDVKTHIDMISFVPVYEYNVEKKIFSKNTYNEIPAGFEVKKNIHFEFKDPAFLNELITILSTVEIYDLVRVDHFSTKLESIKKELRQKSKVILEEKFDYYQSFLNQNLDSLDTHVVDGFKIELPVERYKSYQSYNNSSLSLKKQQSTVKASDKSTSLYYQPVIDKEFDFVINPIILEPVIQVMYEIKLSIKNKKNVPQIKKEYMLISSDGNIKTLRIE